MGFIQAFVGGIGGSFADQWKDFYVPSALTDTYGVCLATKRGQDNGRGSNTKGSENIITNGSRFIIPEGTALVTMQEGKVIDYIDVPGGYTYSSDDINAKSFIAGDKLTESLFKQSWERFKFGGMPGSQMLAFYVNQKEIPNNLFGTQAPVYFDDIYMNAQVGVITRGSYSLKISNPIYFICNFVPAKYLQANSPVYDFADLNNDSCQQLFNEVVGSLASAFSTYANDNNKEHRITKLLNDMQSFNQILGVEIENNFKWQQDRGLTIYKVSLIAIEYDEATRKLFEDVQKADALSGNRGDAFMQQSVARGMEAAGSNEGGGGGAMGMAFMGMGAGAAGGLAGGLQGASQPQQMPPQQNGQAGQPMMSQPQQPVQNQSMTPEQKMQSLKSMLDGGLITQDQYNSKVQDILNQM